MSDDERGAKPQGQLLARGGGRGGGGRGAREGGDEGGGGAQGALKVQEQKLIQDQRTLPRRNCTYQDKLYESQVRGLKLTDNLSLLLSKHHQPHKNRENHDNDEDHENPDDI